MFSGNIINNWVSNSYIFNGTHVKAVDIVPELDFGFLLLVILHCRHLDDSLVREHQAILLQKLVTCHEYWVQHAFIQQKVPHPFWNDDIHFGVPGQLVQILHLGLQHGDHLLLLVQLHNLLSLLDDVTLVHGYDCLGSRFGTEERQDACTAAHVQHHLVLEEVLVL